DGIRDATVTGVQTCALPISPSPVAPSASSPEYTFLLPPSASPLTRRRYGNPCPRPFLRCRSRALAVSGLALSPLPGQSTPLRSRPPAPGFLRSLWCPLGQLPAA